MSKQQTYITVLEDSAGHAINFERWADKRAATVDRKIIELYSAYYGIYKRDIEQAASLAIYATPDAYSERTEVKRYSKPEFMQMISMPRNNI